MSTKRSKRYQEAAKLVIPNKNYSITEAVETMKSFPAPKFDPTVTVSFHLTVDPRKSDQMVRGSVSLPNGTGKNVRVIESVTVSCAMCPGLPVDTASIAKL